MKKYLYDLTESEKAEKQALMHQIEEYEARSGTLEAKEEDEFSDRVSELFLRISCFHDECLESVLNELYDGSYAVLVEKLKNKIKTYIMFEYLNT